MHLLLCNVHFCNIIHMQTIEGSELRNKTGLSMPHTSHCLGTGDIMISGIGDAENNQKGINMYLM